MSVWSRLFGRSKSSQSKSKSRLGLESLEMREVPAIVFVGGWGASQYQYAVGDTHEAAEGRSSGAANYSAIAFVGGWGASSQPGVGGTHEVGHVMPTGPLSTTSANVRLDAPVVDLQLNGNREVLATSTGSENARADASDFSAIAFVGGWGSSSPATGDSLPTEQLSMNYGKIRFDAAPAINSLTVPESRPEPVIITEYLLLLGGTTPLAPATDYLLEIDGIKGQSPRVDPSVKLSADPTKPERDASPLPVLLVIADQRDFNSTIGTGRDVLIANQARDREVTSQTATDDVWVDGKIITGQNFDTTANSGYIRIKKLNSGG